ncbi:MAG: hypothetical protein KC449_30655, partial [Anaerolineales bacterium]|nr:hypothetical protein [Anaerolineales bacterium]
QQQTLTFASHIFPGWQARLDCERWPASADARGQLQVTVPPGDHQLTVQFGRTPVRWLADFLSLAGLMVCLWLVILRGWRLETGDWQIEQISNLQSPISPFILVAGVAIVMLLGKIFWLDRYDTPLVVHAVDGRIPNIPLPPAGNFNNEIRLVGGQTELPNTLTLYWQAVQPTASYRVALTL